MSEGDALEALLQEGRTFPPPESFRKTALDTDASVYDEAERDWQGFWAAQALALDWTSEWHTILEWDLPFAKWFVGGKLNVAYNCLDRHVEAGHGDQVAFYWEGEPGDSRTVTYSELLEETCRVANALRSFGVQKGDRVAIYMGMVPETVADDARLRADRRAALRCVRRLHRAVVEGSHQRRGSQGARDRRRCVAPRRRRRVEGDRRRSGRRTRRRSSTCSCCGAPRTTSRCRTAGTSGGTTRLPAQPSTCACEEMDSEDLLYLLYTSGTTGKPKGIMHSTGGYLTQCAYTHKHVFDLDPDKDVYWCTADVGWVTGHSYIVYGPLANRTTSVLYEGTPDFPDRDRLWSIVEKYKVSIFYTAPTAIRTFMKWGDEFPERHDLSTLRLMGTVGEPINPEAWVWYYQTIGGGRCPVVDTWWQTETGAIMISALPGATTLKPGSATFPLPGIKAGIVDDAGAAVGIPGGGYLTLERPWPSMLRGIWGDPERYRDTYWSRFDGKYFAGDGAKRDDDGYFWLLGRVDDIMLVSGHNISTTEVESALVDHPAVAEAAVVGKADDTTGQAIAAFVILRSGNDPNDELAAELRDHVAELIGPIAKPKTHPVHRRAAEDPLGKDHAPAPPRRRAGSGARRRDDARGSRGRRRHQGSLSRRGSRGGMTQPRVRSLPEHWTWRAEPLTPGAAVVVDIDGVLSDASRRQHYLESPRQDWRVVLRRVR